MATFCYTLFDGIARRASRDYGGEMFEFVTGFTPVYWLSARARMTWLINDNTRAASDVHDGGRRLFRLYRLLVRCCWAYIVSVIPNSVALPRRLTLSRRATPGHGYAGWHYARYHRRDTRELRTYGIIAGRHCLVFVLLSYHMSHCQK